MFDPFAAIARLGVLPVITIEDRANALGLADALLEGGLGVAEITFRTAAARDVIETLCKARPELLVGAGTVLDRASLQAAKSAGAAFGLAPGFDPEVVDAAAALDLPFAPGIMTPSELTAATAHGIRLAKFFPAGIAGGPAALDGIAAPFAHLGIRFIPTGGVTLDNLADWLAVKAVAAVGGTWIARTEQIRAGRFAEIKANAKAAVARVAQLRESRG